jgi:large subunit ribosomal protein L35
VKEEAFVVPKMKSHTGMGKRVRVTGSGKIVREKAGKRHHLEVKPSHVTRRMTGTVVVAKADTKRVKKMLGR